MSENIITEDIIFSNCRTGTDFENKTLDFLRLAGLTAQKTGGANDGGIDIVASLNIQGTEYSYYIQCKYYNKPLGKNPIQEVYTGAAFYNNIGKPVVITNNEVTISARTYAKKLGVEIIADSEWEKIKETNNSQRAKIQHTGLMGIVISGIIKSSEYATHAVATESEHIVSTISEKDKYRLQLQSDFDMAEEYLKEEERLQQKARKYRRMALERQKKAILASFDYG